MAGNKSKANENAKIVHPKIFAVERSINVSRGIMYQTIFDKRNSYKDDLSVYFREGIGTKSNFDKNKTIEQINKEISENNPYKGECCYLHNDNDTLVVKYGVKFLPVTNRISACDNVEYRDCYVKMLQEYIDSYSMNELATRYVNNIVNARSLWRNRIGSDKVETVIFTNKKTYVFDSKSFDLNNFVYDNAAVNELVELVANALSGKVDLLNMEIIHYARLGLGHEVYPSQEFVSDCKDKVLFKIGNNAGLHSEKIGNAIRTIDTWYDDFTKYNVPVAISPYGVAKQISKAFRSGKTSFNSISNKKIIEQKIITENEYHFLVANCIKGGIFGE